MKRYPKIKLHKIIDPDNNKTEDFNLFYLHLVNKNIDHFLVHSLAPSYLQCRMYHSYMLKEKKKLKN